MAIPVGACSAADNSSGSPDSGGPSGLSANSGSASGSAVASGSGSGSAAGVAASTGANAGDSGSASGGSATGAGSGATGLSGASGSLSGSTTGASAGASGGGATGSASGGLSGDGGLGPSGSASGSPGGDAGTIFGDPGLVSIFDGASLNGWIQVPAASWSVVNGALHSLAPKRGFVYTTKTYDDFRFVFTSRLISDPGKPSPHYPCVLFWGNSPNVDALAAIQIQPPAGYMWDYRPGHNSSPPASSLMRFSHPSLTDMEWSQCEMLAIKSTGKVRFACCQLIAPASSCKATELVDFTDPTAGINAPLALQVHNPQMIEEFKNLYVESPVTDPTKLITTQ